MQKEEGLSWFEFNRGFATIKYLPRKDGRHGIILRRSEALIHPALLTLRATRIVFLAVAGCFAEIIAESKCYHSAIAGIAPFAFTVLKVPDHTIVDTRIEHVADIQFERTFTLQYFFLQARRHLPLRFQ